MTMGGALPVPIIGVFPRILLLFHFFPLEGSVVLPHIKHLHSYPRTPPHIPQNPLLQSTLLSDQSTYLQLGDNVGTVLAVGDFTADRFTDLLVIPSYSLPRSVSILCWHHSSYSFRPAPFPSNSSDFLSVFSIDSIPAMTAHASIASASTFDANADGFLDVLLVISLSNDRYVAAIIHGDGSGGLKFDCLLPDVNPYSLILDANDDMLYDIFFVTTNGERIFYINNPPGIFQRHSWQPWPNSTKCVPTYPYNSNSFVDMNGDCSPDLVVTSSCGMEIWLNHSPNLSKSPAWPNANRFDKPNHQFYSMSYPQNAEHFLLLNKTVWDPSNGDGQATFADFNADGSIDIAVLNEQTRTVRISYYVRRAKLRQMLCTADPMGHFVTYTALDDVSVSATDLAKTTISPTLHTGDINFDGLVDILLLDSESGTIALYVASLIPNRPVWFAPRTWPFSQVLKPILFPLIGHDSSYSFPEHSEILKYVRFSDSPILHQLEDPITASFFDVDESGRQDILVAQRHGTRLIWNNCKRMGDYVYFKATGVDIPWVPNRRRKSIPAISFSHLHPRRFSPLPGNTFKLSYGGRHRLETHICSQCPQSAVFSLQQCTCFFGISRIANYIEEMAMGGAHGVHTWASLMPNALAFVWPQRSTAWQSETSIGGGSRNVSTIKWKVSYSSRGRDGQLRKIVCTLGIALGVLLIFIAYMQSAERLREDCSKPAVGYT